MSRCQRRQNVGFQFGVRGVLSFTSKAHNSVSGQVPRFHKLPADRVRSAAQEIPNDRIAAFAGNNNAHPTEVGWAPVNDDEGHNMLAPPPHNLPKVVRRNDTVVALKHRVWLDGDLAAAFAAARCQDCTACARAHTQAETVDFCSSAVVGLISTLGHCVLLGKWPEQSGGEMWVKPQPQKNRAGMEASQTALCGCPQEQTGYLRNRNYD